MEIPSQGGEETLWHEAGEQSRQGMGVNVQGRAVLKPKKAENGQSRRQMASVLGSLVLWVDHFLISQH